MRASSNAPLLVVGAVLAFTMLYLTHEASNARPVNDRVVSTVRSVTDKSAAAAATAPTPVEPVDGPEPPPAPAPSRQLPASTSTEGSSSTKWKCHLRGPWSDLCNYENVCFTAMGKLVFVNDDVRAYEGSTTGMGTSGLKMATKLPLHKPSARRVFPVHYSGQSYTTITPAQLAARKVTWTKSSSSPDGALYVLSYQDSLANIWYYSTRVLPLFTADLHAEELGLPRIAEVLFPMSKDKVDHDWHISTLNLALPRADIPVYYGEDAPYFGLRDQGDDGALVCAKRAVLLGANVYGFTDMVSAHAFRAKAWASVGLPLPPMQAPTETSTIPRNVTVLDRLRSKPRHITNIKATLDVVRKYGVEPNWVTLEGSISFADQVKQMAGTGVLVTVHGAGLMNQIFMPPGAVTIEIFPNHVKHVLYERVAHYVGVYHFKVYATDHPADAREKHAAYFKEGCDNVRSLEIPNRVACWAHVKNMVVVVPLRQFEVALVDSLDFIVRTRLREGEGGAEGPGFGDAQAEEGEEEEGEEAGEAQE